MSGRARITPYVSRLHFIEVWDERGYQWEPHVPFLHAWPVWGDRDKAEEKARKLIKEIDEGQPWDVTESVTGPPTRVSIRHDL